MGQAEPVQHLWSLCSCPRINMQWRWTRVASFWESRVLYFGMAKESFSRHIGSLFSFPRGCCEHPSAQGFIPSVWQRHHEPATALRCLWMSGQEMLHSPGSSFPAHHQACLWWVFNPVWSRSCSTFPLERGSGSNI